MGKEHAQVSIYTKQCELFFQLQQCTPRPFQPRRKDRLLRTARKPMRKKQQ